MRENRWSYRPRKRKWVTTTHSNHDLPIYPNLIKNLTIRNVNQLRVADIISIRILACFVHLAVILDAFSRKAIGYALSQRLDTRLALGALQMAPGDRHPEPDCIHHADPGVQCASREYVKELTSYNVRISMSRPPPLTTPMLRALSNPLSPRRFTCGSTIPWKMSGK